MWRILLMLIPRFGAASAHAAAPAQAAEEGIEAAFNQAMPQATSGPAKADLGNEVAVRLPAGLFLIPGQAAIRLLKACGRVVPTGVVAPLMDADGIVGIGVVHFVRAGLINAGAVGKWPPGDILFSLNELLTNANATRAAESLPPLIPRRWAAPPRYHRGARTLFWAPLILPSTAQADSDSAVTCHAVALGRVIPPAGGFAAAIGTSSLSLDIHRIMRRRARRI